MREHHTQQVEVNAEFGHELSVLSIWDIAPFVTSDEELEKCHEIEWWWEKRSEAKGEKFDALNDRSTWSFKLTDLLEVYDYFGWEHYDTAVSGKRLPGVNDREDQSSVTMILFLRKRKSE